LDVLHKVILNCLKVHSQVLIQSYRLLVGTHLEDCFFVKSEIFVEILGWNLLQEGILQMTTGRDYLECG
jgi:hypothetical protein